jgi:hypothetical protein
VQAIPLVTVQDDWAFHDDALGLQRKGAKRAPAETRLATDVQVGHARQDDAVDGE